MSLSIARIYGPPVNKPGFRILVDRVWPRGITKEEAKIDEWLKDIAPTAELRRWFGHVPNRFAEFKTRYIKEIEANPKTKEFLSLIHKHPDVVLLYGAKDEKHNQAVVLKEYADRS